MGNLSLNGGPQNEEEGNRRVYEETHGVRNGGSQGGASVSMGEPQQGTLKGNLNGDPKPNGDPNPNGEPESLWEPNGGP